MFWKNQGDFLEWESYEQLDNKLLQFHVNTLFHKIHIFAREFPLKKKNILRISQLAAQNL